MYRLIVVKESPFLDQDKLYGGEGSDTIIGGTENDVVFGDSRTEMSYEGSVMVQTPDLIQSKVDGAVYDDTITGGADNLIVGGGGNDNVRGNSCDALLSGGTGNDLQDLIGLLAAVDIGHRLANSFSCNIALHNVTRA